METPGEDSETVTGAGAVKPGKKQMPLPNGFPDGSPQDVQKASEPASPPTEGDAQAARSKLIPASLAVIVALALLGLLAFSCAGLVRFGLLYQLEVFLPVAMGAGILIVTLMALTAFINRSPTAAVRQRLNTLSFAAVLLWLPWIVVLFIGC